MVRFLRLLFPVLAFALVACEAVAGARQNDAHPAVSVDALDGRRFTGEFIPTGKASGRSDVFIFANGKFHSRECLKFGFSPGPYWVRLENGRLHFRARLTSEENGVMTYEGAVDGAKIDASIEWVRPRWYWTMKRDFRFEGVANKTAAAQGK